MNSIDSVLAAVDLLDLTQADKVLDHLIRHIQKLEFSAGLIKESSEVKPPTHPELEAAVMRFQERFGDT